MSTGSGTSLGDSGTHSDPDDKKTIPCEVSHQNFPLGFYTYK